MKIGAQLYTVRMFAQNERDLGRTLEKIAAMGYEYVQVSGIGNIAPEKVKHLCDANGLIIVLTHNPEHRFLGGIDALIEEHLMYGAKYVGLGMMTDRYRTPDMFDDFFRDFEKPLQKLMDSGMLFMYHNHALEFARLADGSFVLSTSFGRNNDSFMLVYNDVTKNDSDFEVDYSGKKVSAYHLSNQRKAATLREPPMLEGIDANGNEVIGIFESGAEKYSDSAFIVNSICSFKVK